MKHDGLDNYVAKAEPLLLGWKIDEAPVEVYEFNRLTWWDDLHDLGVAPIILDSRITKIAQNIAFERAFLRKLGLGTPLSQWIDTSVLARYAGLPSKLRDISKALKLGDHGKDDDGTRLINKFCKPKKDGTYRDKHSDPEDWEKFKLYCKSDVGAEYEVFVRLKFFMLPEREKRLWLLDEKINRRGLPVDMTYVDMASRQAATEKQKLMAELKGLTGLANPNSRDQFLGWAKLHGYSFASLGKDFIARFEKILEEDEAC